jgi:hypothetical protein
MAWPMWVVGQGNLCVPKEKEKKKPHIINVNKDFFLFP